jgi:hypothetical protein
MTEWPKNPGYNDFEGTVEPAGPMNVFNERLATVAAVNAAIAAKTTYDTAHPAPAPVTPPVVPPGTPISPGSPVTVDQSRYMIDPTFKGFGVSPHRR